MLALALLVLVTPGATELLEDATHYAIHGDTFHDAGHDDDHCCSGAFHFCSCHARTHAAPGPTAAALAAEQVLARALPDAQVYLSGGPADAHRSELIRPPSA